MSEADDLTEGLEDQSYEIKNELEIRKKLEAETDWQFQFEKNGKFAYDLEITGWDDEPRSTEDSHVLGYVELERARADKPKSWITGDIPNDWPYLSFLQRKVRKYDYEESRWGGLKDDFRRTVYLKFNHGLTNCFAAPIEAIYKDGTRTKKSDGTAENTYLALNKDHNDVYKQIDGCVGFIEDFLTKNDPEQTGLDQWGDD